MLYPKALFASDTPDGNHGDHEVKAVISDHTITMIIEVATKSFPNGNLDDVWKWGVGRVKDNRNVKLLSANPYSVRNYQGFTTEYLDSVILWNNKTINYHCMDWYYLDNNTMNGYAFDYCVDQQYWEKSKDVFLIMIGSITITPPL